MAAVKKLLCVMGTALLIFIIFTSAAYAITVDGIIENLEWKKAEQLIIFPNGTKTDSAVNFAAVKVQANRIKNEVFLAFQVTQKAKDTLNADNSLAGVICVMKSGDYITCRSNAQPAYDINLYSVDAKIVIGANNDFTVEMRIGFKSGIPEKIMLGLQLIDGYGIPSDFYNWPAKLGTASGAATTGKHEQSTTAKPAATTHNNANGSGGDIASTSVSNGGSPEDPQTTADTLTSEGTTARQNAGGLTQQGQVVSGMETTEAQAAAAAVKRIKHFSAAIIAFMLIAAAVCLSVYAGMSKAKKVPEPPEKETPGGPGRKR